MLGEKIEYTLRLNLWYTFDGRPMRGVEVKESGEKLTAAFRPIKQGLPTYLSAGLIILTFLYRHKVMTSEELLSLKRKKYQFMVRLWLGLWIGIGLVIFLMIKLW